jgi:hypothetical protein
MCDILVIGSPIYSNFHAIGLRLDQFNGSLVIGVMGFRIKILICSSDPSQAPKHRARRQARSTWISIQEHATYHLTASK